MRWFTEQPQRLSKPRRPTWRSPTCRRCARLLRYDSSAEASTTNAGVLGGEYLEDQSHRTALEPPWGRRAGTAERTNERTPTAARPRLHAGRSAKCVKTRSFVIFDPRIIDLKLVNKFFCYGSMIHKVFHRVCFGILYSTFAGSVSSPTAHLRLEHASTYANDGGTLMLCRAAVAVPLNASSHASHPLVPLASNRRERAVNGRLGVQIWSVLTAFFPAFCLLSSFKGFGYHRDMVRVSYSTRLGRRALCSSWLIRQRRLYLYFETSLIRIRLNNCALS